MNAKKKPIEDLSMYYHYTLRDASQLLNKSQSGLKELCRQNGIKKWPNRYVRNIKSLYNTLKCLSLSGSISTETRLLYHENIKALYRLLEKVLCNQWQASDDEELDQIKISIHDTVRDMTPRSRGDEGNRSQSSQEFDTETFPPIPLPTHPAVIRVLQFEDDKNLSPERMNVNLNDNLCDMRELETSRSISPQSNDESAKRVKFSFFDSLEALNTLGATVDIDPSVTDDMTSDGGKKILFSGPVQLPPLQISSQFSPKLEMSDANRLSDRFLVRNNVHNKVALILPALCDNIPDEIGSPMVFSYFDLRK